MSFVAKKLSHISKVNKKRQIYSERIQKKIDALQSKLWNTPDSMKKTVSDSVIEDLQKIAQNGNEGSTWKAFDDPDIKWYLTDYPINAPGHNELRDSYNEWVASPKKDGFSLPFWRLSKDDAIKLLAEIDSHMEKK